MWTLLFLASAGEGQAAEGEHATRVLFKLLGLDVTSQVTTTWAIMATLTFLAWAATRNLRREPKGLQNALEMVVEGLLNFFAGIMGRRMAEKTLPFLGTLFLFILVSNYSGLIPGAGYLPGFAAPTSTWSVTAGLAVCAIIAVQVYGVQEKGWGFFKHLAQPWFLLPINLLEELVRPLSLSLRLYGNIFGEEAVAAAMLGVIPFILPMAATALGLIFGLVQAVIFTVLTAVYISVAAAEHH